MAVVAKGVSPPCLDPWLLICLFSNKSAAYLAALLYLVPAGFAPRLFDFAQSTAKTNTVEILAGDCNVPIDGGRGPLGTRQGYSRRRTSLEDRSAGCLPRRASVKVVTGRWIDYMHLTKLNGQWLMLDVVLQIQAVNRFHYFSRPFRSSISWSAGFRQRFPDSQFSPPPASRKKRSRTPQMTSI
jgi:hypothetical protein